MLEVMAGDTMQIVQHIKKGKIEIGIVGAKTDDPKITQEKLLKDEMKLIVPANHRWAKKTSIDVSNLFEEPFIAREKGSGTWQSIVKAVEDAGLNPKEIKACVTMGNTVSVIQSIKHHVGISILSPIAVQDEIESGQLAALSVNGIHLNRFFYLTFSTNRAMSPICKKFMAFAQLALQ